MPSPARAASGLLLDPGAQDLLFREARTAQAFTDDPVSDAQVEAVVELTRWAPTASNQQPLRVLLIRSPGAKDRLEPHLKGGNREKTRRAPVTAVLAADTRFFEHWDRLQPKKAGRGASFADDPAEAERQARLSATLQAGYFVLGVRAAGLAAGPMGGFDAAGVDAEFFPDGRLRTVLLVNVGHPAADAWGDRQPRLDPAEVVTAI